MVNQGPVAIAFFAATASFILFILFRLLSRDLSAKFFRLWIAGWGLFCLHASARIVTDLQGGALTRWIVQESYLLALTLFLAAVCAYTETRIRAVWLGAIAAAGSLLLAYTALAAPQRYALLEWSRVGLQSGVSLTAGWILYRHTQRRRGHGALLLAAALLLVGLHGLDEPLWGAHPVSLLRIAFAGLLQVVLGIAMAVMVLEAGRARTEDLNAKLSRLTLITAANTQTLGVEEVLKEILLHVVDSLRAARARVWLVSGEGEKSELVLRASVGRDGSRLGEGSRTPSSEPWVQTMLRRASPVLFDPAEADAELRRHMAAEGLTAIVPVRLTGKEEALGLLEVGASQPRQLQAEEISFLIQVANLMGLTVQNVWLLEQASTAERNWMHTFDAITDPILVHDQEFRIQRGNQALGGRLGIFWQEMVGKRVSEIFRQDTVRWSDCPYCERVLGAGIRHDPYLGGYFLVSSSSIHGPQSGRRSTVHVLRDITDRKLAEEKYRTLIENVQEGVFISTPDGRFVDFNLAFLRMAGYDTREELLAVQDASHFYVNPADRDRLKQLLRENGAVSDFEFQMRRRDGEILTVLESSFATRDAAGEVVAYQGFVLDITERKRAEQEIRRRNRELIVLNAISEILNQPHGLQEILAQSLRQLAELFRLDVASVHLLEPGTQVLQRAATVGLRSAYARHFPSTPLTPELLHHLEEVRATLLPGQLLHLPDVFRDFQKREGIAISYLVVLWAKERIIGWLFAGMRTMRDFSTAELNLLAAVGGQMAAGVERSWLHEQTREAYENLRRTQEQLLQSEKMAAVGQLISGVAHELNNPLTAILGYSQLLAGSEYLTPRDLELLNKLHRQAQRTHRIVNNLLSFARQHKPERRPVNMNQVVEDTLALRDYDLRINNIRVRREFLPDLPLTTGDPHQLQQVFLNILNNAVDAILETQVEGEVWVRTWVQDSSVLVQFTDSGRGVREPHRVFDPFYTTKPVGKGTGLGLSICYGIVSEHGGSITVENATREGRGASFTVSLPLLPVEELRETPPSAVETQPPFGHVLLVDDEPAVLDLEVEILQGKCLAIRRARDGAEAIAVLERAPVDLIVTDLKMPGEIDGRSLYDWIRRCRPELASRVVFTMSGAGTEELAKFVAQSGCPSVQKPFGVDDFLAVLRRATETVDASDLNP